MMHSRWIPMACLAVALFTLSGSLPAAEPAKLPEFLKKVQLHNFAGVELAKDGQGVMLYRLPKSVRDRMTEANKHSGKTGADQMLYARQSEIRFVLNPEEKIENVKLHLQSTAAATVTYYWGDVLVHGTVTLRPGGKNKPLGPRGHGLLYNLMDKLPRGRFDNRVCRIVFDGGELVLTDIEGDLRPPNPEELAPVMMSYGTSISQGWAASRGDLAWNSLTARLLGYDLVNLGCSGTAYCETAVADYIASQPWDLCVLEVSVNMVGGYSTEEFRRRVAYMVETLAKSHPGAPIVCISLFPWGIGEYWANNPAHSKAKELRQALEEICRNSKQENVHFVPGPELLSMTGLSEDMLHPSDHGMIEIATKLVPRIKEVLKK